MTPIETSLMVGLEEAVSDLRFLADCLENDRLSAFCRDSATVCSHYLWLARMHEQNREAA